MLVSSLVQFTDLPSVLPVCRIWHSQATYERPREILWDCNARKVGKHTAFLLQVAEEARGPQLRPTLFRYLVNLSLDSKQGLTVSQLCQIAKTCPTLVAFSFCITHDEDEWTTASNSLDAHAANATEPPTVVIAASPPTIAETRDRHKVFSSTIERLNITFTPSVNPQYCEWFLEFPLSALANLREVSLSKLPIATSLRSLVKLSPPFEELTLVWDCGNVWPVDIESIRVLSHRLRVLSLHSRYKSALEIDTEFLYPPESYFADGSPTLQRAPAVSFSGSDYDENEDEEKSYGRRELEYAFRKAPMLTFLAVTIDDDQKAPHLLKLIPQFKMLTCLDLDIQDANISVSLQHVAMCAGLVKLSLRGVFSRAQSCETEADDWANALRSLPHLRKLYVDTHLMTSVEWLIHAGSLTTFVLFCITKSSPPAVLTIGLATCSSIKHIRVDLTQQDYGFSRTASHLDWVSSLISNCHQLPNVQTVEVQDGMQTFTISREEMRHRMAQGVMNTTTGKVDPHILLEELPIPWRGM